MSLRKLQEAGVWDVAAVQVKHGDIRSPLVANGADVGWLEVIWIQNTDA